MARSLNIRADLVIGDLDSVTDKSDCCDYVEYPPVKDQTDSHLAISYACNLGYDLITVLIWPGGRLDHVLGTIFSATGFTDKASFRFIYPAGEAVLCQGPSVVAVNKKLIVSLLPVSDVVSGITTRDLLYKLDQEQLFMKETRGISNEAVTVPAQIEIGSGTILITACRE